MQLFLVVVVKVIQVLANLSLFFFYPKESLFGDLLSFTIHSLFSSFLLTRKMVVDGDNMSNTKNGKSKTTLHLTKQHYISSLLPSQ